jgi:hypothetical protein
MPTSGRPSTRRELPYEHTPTQLLKLLYEAEIATVNLTPRQTAQSWRRRRAMADELDARGETLHGTTRSRFAR